MKKIGVLTSGGDAPGMNAAIRAVVRVAIYNGLEVVGIKRGYQGLIEGDIVNMDVSSVGDIIHRGGTKLRSARSLEFKTEEGLNKAINVLKTFRIDGLIVIGGDGSFRGAEKLCENGIPTIGIPATIDNDLGYTDYTIGFFTALMTVVNAIGNVRDTSTAHGRTNIIEVMGRNCGDIALYAGLAGGAESIIIPEIEFDIDEISENLIRGKNRGKLHSIILLAEGVGKPYKLAEELEIKTGIKTRVSVIGYLQRGGTPTPYDRVLASRFGAEAVNLLINGDAGKLVGIKGNEIISLNIKEALVIPREIDNDLFKLTQILAI
ncbi:6-phosphofructokinase [Clostridiaceae bacterium HSG29]|nr:6-phosphofructokinase [Clostridiaceae bacterium HSG29]